MVALYNLALPVSLADNAGIALQSIMRKGNDYYIRDGSKETASTNGTWIFAEFDYELEDGSEIKVGESIIRVSVYG